MKPVIKNLPLTGCGYTDHALQEQNTPEDSLLKKMKTENLGSKIQLTVRSLASAVGATQWLINCLKYFVILVF